MVHRSRFHRFPLVVALALFGACEEKQAPKPEPENKTDGGGARERARGVDKNLEEAVAAVAGGQGGPAGPPPTGVFAKGAADREIRPSDPPKLTLGGKGSTPTITFATSTWKPGRKRETMVEISVQTGPQSALPTVDVTFSLEATEPKAEAAASAGGAPASPSGPLEVLAKVTGTKLAREQPGQLPPGLDAELAKIKGTVIRLEVQPNGAGHQVGFEPAKGADESLSQIARTAGDALTMELLPYPSEPVGVGAFWMVASREPFLGLDVLAYRMVKVEKIEGARVTLSVSTKRYAAGGQIALAGIPLHEVAEFAGNGNAELVVPAADPFALGGQGSDVLMANLTAQTGGPQGGRIGIQLQMRSTIRGK